MAATSPLKNVLILADDLTGAADSAARCRHAGLPASIFLQPPTLPLPPGAVAFTTDSRHLSAGEAAARVAAVAAKLAEVPHAVWYKKIDSTLRGNLGSEVDALLNVIARSQIDGDDGEPCVVFSPGFPAQARGLKQGWLVMAQAGAPRVHLPTLLRSQSERPVRAIGLDAVRAGVDALARELKRSRTERAQLLVVDAMIEADLQTVLAATQQALPGALLCGSAGLVGVLAKELAEGYAAPAAAQAEVGRVLGVVGSGSAMAHRQLDALRARDDVQLVQTHPDESTPLPDDVRSIGAAVLHLPPPPVDAVLDGPQARRLAAHLADVAAQWVLRMEPERLVLVGGDTSVALLERLGIERLQVHRELLPGMPLTTGTDATGRTRQIVLKAGNHGDESTLATLLGLA